MYLAWFYIAWTLRIEHKPKCICPCLSSHNRIFQICYPTDFDFNHTLSPENPPQTPRCRDKPLGLSLSCWTDLKVCPYVFRGNDKLFSFRTFARASIIYVIYTFCNV